MASKPAGIFKRGSTYYARFFVPADQQERLGKEDVAWSLKTGDLREARKRLPALQARFEALITPPDPHRQQLEERYGIPAALPADEALRRLTLLSQAAQQVDAVHWAAQRALAAQVDPVDFGLDVDGPEPPAPTEADRLDALYGHRAESGAFVEAAAAAGMPAAQIAPVEDATAALKATGTTAGQAGGALTMTGLIDRWAAERKPKPKTLDEVRKSASLLTAALGIEKAPGDLTKQDFVEFKGWLLKQPGRDGKGYASGSILKRLNLIKTVLSYAEAELIITSNPASKVTVAKTKKLPRQPFSLADLDLLFSPENLPKTPTHRWLMMLGLYTGARLNELCQLQCQDLKREDGIWYLSIDDAADDDDEGEQSIKTEGSRRHVALHPAIIESGFIAFVGKRQGRIFDDLEYDQMQGFGKAASKALNKTIRSLIPDKRKVFHSFRHTFKSLARNAGMPEDVHDFLTGHAGGHVGRDYGHGHGLKVALAEVSKIEGRWRLR